MGRRAVYEITLRRPNGRWVQTYTRNSQYSAKEIKRILEEKYDETYYVSIDKK